ncbi:MAG: hypothetical protein RBT45_06605 [Acholeplasmataceae bacterium]|jgi:hypothetical protein|nr:hypothetical protein [Acholeplasmataceae bacterium]
MNSPYLSEKKTLVDRLVKLYPYPRQWFENKSNHVLIALLNKKNRPQ